MKAYSVVGFLASLFLIIPHLIFSYGVNRFFQEIEENKIEITKVATSGVHYATEEGYIMVMLIVFAMLIGLLGFSSLKKPSKTVSTILFFCTFLTVIYIMIFLGWVERMMYWGRDWSMMNFSAAQFMPEANSEIDYWTFWILTSSIFSSILFISAAISSVLKYLQKKQNQK